jgi:enoyl-CoA hydratase/carnithine racemase
MQQVSGELEITTRDGIQTIRITRGGKKNALTTPMYQAMLAALEEADRSDAIAATIITGSGGVFTAGNDINDFLKGVGAGEELHDRPVHRFVQYLPRVETPLIAAVDGLAIGIGTTLLFHCDLVYATPAARFSTPFLDLGLVPEAASSLLAPRRMGNARAFELLALGEVFDAERAREAGIVNQIVPGEELEASARRAAARLAAKPPAALKIARRLLRGDPQEIVDRLDAEARLFSERLRSPEAREAFEAFLEKRPANFRRG